MTTSAHLFFSYAHADDATMIPLHARMQAALGHTIWIDKVGLERGKEWEKSIELAIQESYGVIFAVTKNFCNPDRIFIRDREIPLTIDRFGKVQGPVIFPIIFDDVDLPPALETALNDKDLKWLFHTIDFRDHDEASLFAELKQHLPQPVAGNHPFIIDWPRLANFQGRNDLLIELHDKLKNAPVGIKTAGLHGMGGIGKTQLAVEYAHRYRFHYPAGVYWINAARPDWTAEVAEIAERLGLQAAEAQEGGKREQQLAVALERHLKTLGGDALIILDNVENPADVASRVIGPKLHFTDLPARLLITTRRQDLPAGFAGLPVDVLSMQDARALLLAVRPAAVDDPAIDEICHALGYLPLALGLTAAALKKRLTMKPAAFLNHLREKGVDAVAGILDLSPGDIGAPEDYVIRLDAILDWHSELIGENARDLIALAAAYGEAAELPLARLRILFRLKDDPDALEQPFSDGLTELRDANMVESPGVSVIRLHPLVRDYVRRNADTFALLFYGAGRLLEAYRDPQTIYNQAAARGFAALIADLRDTINISTSASAWYDADLQNLLRLFDWEGHHLRDWNPETDPAYLIQHLRERAHHQSDDAFRDACDKWLMPFIHFRTTNTYRFPHDPAMLRILVGHDGVVNAVVVLPDGKHALSTSYDHSLRLWDIRTGRKSAASTAI